LAEYVEVAWFCNSNREGLMEQLNITVNGKDYELQIKPSANLLDVIREDLGLTGTKEGCGIGECGACTVIVDGITVNACLMLAMEAQGSRITTIEGLADGEKLHPIQQAFMDVGGLQCGFCTPGMILSTKVLLDATKSPTDEEIKKGLEGNFCRCTGYTKIIESVRTAANMLKEGR
jgi:carbon-monoxide dehydrogenase small subunit